MIKKNALLIVDTRGKYTVDNKISFRAEKMTNLVKKMIKTNQKIKASGKLIWENFNTHAKVFLSRHWIEASSIIGTAPLGTTQLNVKNNINCMA